MDNLSEQQQPEKKTTQSAGYAYVSPTVHCLAASVASLQGFAFSLPCFRDHTVKPEEPSDSMDEEKRAEELKIECTFRGFDTKKCICVIRSYTGRTIEPNSRCD